MVHALRLVPGLRLVPVLKLLPALKLGWYQLKSWVGTSLKVGRDVYSGWVLVGMVSSHNCDNKATLGPD